MPSIERWILLEKITLFGISIIEDFSHEKIKNIVICIRKNLGKVYWLIVPTTPKNPSPSTERYTPLDLLAWYWSPCTPT